MSFASNSATSKFRKKFLLVPLATVFLLLAMDAFLISRMDEVPSIYREHQGMRFPSFHTKDLQGNAVTQEIFAGKFSVVCLWVSQDAENSRKMWEELFAWRRASGKAVQLVGIVGDLREGDSPERLAAVRRMAEGWPEDAPQLLASDAMEGFLKRIRSAPTVCFVDENGNLAGQPVAGVEPALVEKEAERLMESSSPRGERAKMIQESLFHRP